jgi:RsiW-degrading membrane proteinase PrsW (M82 family)
MHPGYYPYPYAYPHSYYMPPRRPSRDTYLFVIAILSTIASSLAFLSGLICIPFAITYAASLDTLGSQVFGGIMLFTALALAGVVGGGSGLYHSIRSLARRPSAQMKLPWFWLFLILYTLVMIIAYVLRANGAALANLPASIFLIALAGVLPALTILSLAVRRLHLRGSPKWPTRWRRFVLAIVTGATSAILLATIAELILTYVAANAIGLTSSSLSSIDNPNSAVPSDPRYIAFLLILVSVIAPLVEEGVKPIAVIALIGRIESAAEAFVLGLSCGVGFDLIETSGYISQGGQDWANVAIQRSTAGLLHGFGAGMVALGWYFITHRKGRNNSVLLGIGCIIYAVLQHAIWNGSFVLQLLPAPIGPYLANGTIGSGAYAFPAFLIVYVVLSALMLVFFLFVTGRIRPKKPDAPNAPVVPALVSANGISRQGEEQLQARQNGSSTQGLQPART